MTDKSASGAPAKDEMLALVTDDFVGVSEWKRSKVSAVTGFGYATRLVKQGRDIVTEVRGRMGPLLRVLTYQEGGAKLHTDSTDASVRFQAARRQYGMNDAALAAFQQNNYRHFLFFACAAMLLFGLGLASFGMFDTGLWLPLDLANRFCLVVPVLALTLRAGVYNWQARTRSLGSVGEYLRTPSAWWPTPVSTGNGPPSAGGMGRLATLSLFILTAAAAMHPHLSFAQTATTASTTNVFAIPGTSDIWRHLLEIIFPGVGPLSGSATTASNALSSALGSFLAVLMVCGTSTLAWHVIAGLVATAHEGTVLGKNWHTVWAPIRVTMGIGFLAPVVKGYCLAQVLVLTIACWSGSFGNVLWSSYISALVTNTVAAPDLPQTGAVVQSFAKAEFCSAGLNEMATENGSSFAGLPASNTSPTAAATNLTTVNGIGVTLGNAWNNLTNWTNSSASQSSMADDRSWEEWNYGPCGSIGGAFAIGGTNSFGQAADTFDTSRLSAIATLQTALRNAAHSYVTSMTGTSANAGTRASAMTAAISAIASAKSGFDTSIKTADSTLASSVGGAMSSANTSTFQTAASQAGWASAGSFYMVVSRMQGATMSLASNLPSMDTVAPDGDDTAADSLKTLQAPNTGMLWLLNQAFETAAHSSMSAEMVSNDLSAGVHAGSPGESDAGISGVLAFLFRPIVTNINTYVTGIAADSTVSPLQQMTDFGNRLLNTAMAIGTIGVVMMLGSKGIAGKALGFLTGGATTTISEWLMKVVFAALVVILLVGILHAYVLPMIPYLQFMFFTISMLVLVAESVIAAPLWALMHIRMDGQELVGGQQEAGYKILFNLFLRIPLAMLGLFLGIAVFQAGIWLLDATFYPAMLSATADNSSGPIGACVMLIMMSFVHWHMAIRSFSLVTAVPDRVGRWMGAGDDAHADGKDGHSDVVAGAVSHVEQKVVPGAMAGMQMVGGGKDGEVNSQKGVAAVADVAKGKVDAEAGKDGGKAVAATKAAPAAGGAEEVRDDTG